MVGAEGFEPSAFWSRTKRATSLRYAPWLLKTRLRYQNTGKSQAHYFVLSGLSGLDFAFKMRDTRKFPDFNHSLP